MAISRDDRIKIIESYILAGAQTGQKIIRGYTDSASGAGLSVRGSFAIITFVNLIAPPQFMAKK